MMMIAVVVVVLVVVGCGHVILRADTRSFVFGGVACKMFSLFCCC